MMAKQAPVEDALMTALVGKGSKQASTKLGRFGDITKRPPTWAGIAGVLALSGPRGRQAATRASASYVAGALAHLALKVAVGRSRPPGASRHTSIGPVTSSFPSGHCASELAFSLGAAQEVRWLFVPLSTRRRWPASGRWSAAGPTTRATSSPALRSPSWWRWSRRRCGPPTGLTPRSPPGHQPANPVAEVHRGRGTGSGEGLHLCGTLVATSMSHDRTSVTGSRRKAHPVRTRRLRWRRSTSPRRHKMLDDRTGAESMANNFPVPPPANGETRSHPGSRVFLGRA